jgi:hypothetical protein
MSDENVENIVLKCANNLIANIAKNVFHQTKNASKTITTTSFIKYL